MSMPTSKDMVTGEEVDWEESLRLEIEEEEQQVEFFHTHVCQTHPEDASIAWKQLWARVTLK